ncbi:ABC transporter ATP-binding protein [Microbacterium testaceum]|uniref:ABC transporter ATP-binding protein n=1 Tax=Microbacterium testaceum TaxID=2033 RepID=UPI001CD9C235|nr:ABC transporter ATP-binding protein [Microbacterium testaceum]
MTAPSPGIPPLLPDDIVVPPRPPLPADVAAKAAAARVEESAAEAPVDPTPADVAVEEPAIGDEPAAAPVTDADEPVTAVLLADEPVDETRAGSTRADVEVEELVVADAAAPVVVDEPAADPTSADVAVEEPAVADEPAAAPVVVDDLPVDPTPADVAVEEPPTRSVPSTEAEPTETDAPTPEPAETELSSGPEAEAELVIETPLEHDDATVTPAETAHVVPGASSGNGPLADEPPVADAHPPAEEPTSTDAHPLAEKPTGPDAHPLTDEDPTPADVRADELDPRDEPKTSVLELGDDATAVPAAAVVDVAGGASTASVDESAVPALALRHISKNFGELRAVDAIDLTVPAGAFYGLVGPNGAGKTTTLSIIAGLLRPDRGTVTINGVDAAKRSREAKKLIGVLPDRLRTFDRLTGRQLLSYYGALRGLPAALVESRTADLARAFDLVEALSRPVSDYSAGMTKKVMLAGAMIHSPRLLVLDEPFEAVDPVSSGVILDILGTYVDHGGTVILSSHGMELVERVCSRVAVIVSGQVLAEGTVDEVRGEGTLEERFRELSGGLGDVEGLEWLHTFSA